jgi:hypothetical protein
MERGGKRPQERQALQNAGSSKGDQWMHQGGGQWMHQGGGQWMHQGGAMDASRGDQWMHQGGTNGCVKGGPMDASRGDQWMRQGGTDGCVIHARGGQWMHQECTEFTFRAGSLVLLRRPGPLKFCTSGDSGSSSDGLPWMYSSTNVALAALSKVLLPNSCGKISRAVSRLTRQAGKACAMTARRRDFRLKV